ncbi:MAG: permease [Pseudomonadota bacterium]
MNTPLDIYSFIGFLGTACVIGAYAYLTWQDEPNPCILHGTNLTGAALLTVSLVVHTNWPSLVLEGFWAAIAIAGLVKAMRRPPESEPVEP